jgi:hypothetical protein
VFDSELPGATVYPLIYRDPELIKYAPNAVDESRTPNSETSISLPEHRSLNLCGLAHPNISSVSREV